jgi:hypothetical protein
VLAETALKSSYRRSYLIDLSPTTPLASSSSSLDPVLVSCDPFDVVFAFSLKQFFSFWPLLFTPFSKQRNLFRESEALSGYTEKADRMSTTTTNRTER